MPTAIVVWNKFISRTLQHLSSKRYTNTPSQHTRPHIAVFASKAQDALTRCRHAVACPSFFAAGCFATAALMTHLPPVLVIIPFRAIIFKPKKGMYFRGGKHTRKRHPDTAIGHSFPPRIRRSTHTCSTHMFPGEIKGFGVVIYRNILPLSCRRQGSCHCPGAEILRVKR
jgi:hypothetical protein